MRKQSSDQHDIYTQKYTVCGHTLPNTVSAHVRCENYKSKEAAKARRVGSGPYPNRERVKKTADNECQECTVKEIRERKRRKTEALDRILVGESNCEGGSEDEDE